MSQMFSDTLQGLAEALAIKEGLIAVTKVDECEAPTYRAVEVTEIQKRDVIDR